MTARRTSGIAELNDLVRNSDGLSILAASNETASKSAVGFEKASQDTWKETSKQAWAPTSRQNLSSSSSRFSGSVEPNYRGYAVAVGVVPSIESLNNFGRVRIFLVFWTTSAAAASHTHACTAPINTRLFDTNILHTGGGSYFPQWLEKTAGQIRGIIRSVIWRELCIKHNNF